MKRLKNSYFILVILFVPIPALAAAVCIGDSVTQGYPAPANERLGDNSWCGRLSEMTHRNILNFAVGGSSSSDWLAAGGSDRVSFDALRIIKTIQPDTCYIALGINDARNQTRSEEFTRNILEISRACGSAKVVIVTPPPSKSESIRKLERMYSFDLRQVFQRALFVDVFSAWGSDYQPKRMIDDVHPNAVGQQLIADFILQCQNDEVKDK